MKIELIDVSKGRRGRELPTTSFSFRSGEARFVLAETEQRPTVLGLIATGRMRQDTGTVTIDGKHDTKAMRRRLALVDAMEVSDPPPNVSLAGVVSEELMFAGRRSTPMHVREWLRSLGFDELRGLPMGDIDPAARVRILCELAVLRKGVDGFVLVRPDRHGGRPDGWWRIATEFAERGYAVLVIVGGSAAIAIERMPDLLAVYEAQDAVTEVVDDFVGIGTDVGSDGASGSEPAPNEPAEAIDAAEAIVGTDAPADTDPDTSPNGDADAPEDDTGPSSEEVPDPAEESEQQPENEEGGAR